MNEPWRDSAFPFTAPVPCRVRTGPAPDAPLVVLCHGMGEDPGRCLADWPALAVLPVHMIVPGGPLPHEIRSGGEIRIGRAWYLYDGGQDLFRTTLTRSAAWLHGLIQRVEATQGWEPRDRALVGFSQGAYFGGVVALEHQDLFGRLVSVSGRIKLEFAEVPAAGRLRTLVAHGIDDRAVPLDAARSSVEGLRALGYEAELLLFPGGHRMTPDRDLRISEWLSGEWNLDDRPFGFR